MIFSLQSIAVAAVLCNRLADAFEIPNVFAAFKKPASFPIGSNSVAKTKAELLEAISYTNNGKDADIETQRHVLELVNSLEMAASVSDSLLSDPNEAMILDGTWYLQYTSPSTIGDEKNVSHWIPDRHQIMKN